MEMAGDNSEQIRDWDGPVGERWAAEQETLDQLTAPYGAAALAAAGAKAGERVIDVGCGCGDTSLTLARAVGAEGSVLGVDVSGPMLQVAIRRAKAAGLSQVRFEQADASSARLPGEQDLLFSRFGVMFFAAPVPAFAHLRRALRDSGRMAFVCWQGARENPWAMVPVMAARAALGVTDPPGDPHAPGPFAFGDADRLRMILLEANFRDVAIDPFEAAMPLGSTARSAAEAAARIGPAARLVREAPPEKLPTILDAVEKALEPLVTNDGVALPGRTWIVNARAG